MNSNAEAWVAALRSGEYEQGHYNLKVQIEGEPPQYCCLGVACELALAAGIELDVDTSPDSARVWYDGKSACLPLLVRNWLGLRDENGIFYDEYGWQDSLSTRNDTGSTFDEIARIIEREPEGLFSNDYR